MEPKYLVCPLEAVSSIAHGPMQRNDTSYLLVYPLGQRMLNEILCTQGLDEFSGQKSEADMKCLEP